MNCFFSCMLNTLSTLIGPVSFVLVLEFLRLSFRCGFSRQQGCFELLAYLFNANGESRFGERIQHSASGLAEELTVWRSSCIQKRLVELGSSKDYLHNLQLRVFPVAAYILEKCRHSDLTRPFFAMIYPVPEFRISSTL